MGRIVVSARKMRENYPMFARERLLALLARRFTAPFSLRTSSLRARPPEPARYRPLPSSTGSDDWACRYRQSFRRDVNWIYPESNSLIQKMEGLLEAGPSVIVLTQGKAGATHQRRHEYESPFGVCFGCRHSWRRRYIQCGLFSSHVRARTTLKRRPAHRANRSTL